MRTGSLTGSKFQKAQRAHQCRAISRDFCGIDRQEHHEHSYEIHSPPNAFAAVRQKHAAAVAHHARGNIVQNRIAADRYRHTWLIIGLPVEHSLRRPSKPNLEHI